MSTTTTPPSSTDILRSLRLLRSTEPLERARAIGVLSGVQGDPRIQQVFEHLYEVDPDPRVRHAAWKALHQAGPAIPAPGPVSAPAPALAAPAAPIRPLMRDEPEVAMGTSRRKSTSSGRRSSARQSRAAGPFLFDPGNKHIIQEQREQRAKQKRSGRAALWIAVLSLLVTAVLIAFVLPEMRDWYHLRDGETGYATITDLSEDEVAYTFEVVGDDGTTESYSDTQPITETQYDDLKLLADNNEPVEITYWADDPDLSETIFDNPDHDQRDRLALAVAVMLIVTLLFMSLGMVQRQSGRRMLRVLPGQVVECTGTTDADGDFKLKLRYAFKSPRTDRVITAQRTAIRNDLRGTPLPTPGTRVAVHYRTDRDYTLL